MNEGACDLSDVSYLVLDEADRMLDQGFEREVRKIIAATHVDRQTCLFRWSTCPLSFLQLALGSRDLSQAEEKILLLQVEQLIK